MDASSLIRSGRLITTSVSYPLEVDLTTRRVTTRRPLEMKVDKETVPRTSICTADEHTMVARGRDRRRDLIGKISLRC